MGTPTKEELIKLANELIGGMQKSVNVEEVIAKAGISAKAAEKASLASRSERTQQQADLIMTLNTLVKVGASEQEINLVLSNVSKLPIDKNPGYNAATILGTVMTTLEARKKGELTVSNPPDLTPPNSDEKPVPVAKEKATAPIDLKEEAQKLGGYAHHYLEQIEAQRQIHQANPRTQVAEKVGSRFGGALGETAGKTVRNFIESNSNHAKAAYLQAAKDYLEAPTPEKYETLIGAQSALQNGGHLEGRHNAGLKTLVTQISQLHPQLKQLNEASGNLGQSEVSSINEAYGKARQGGPASGAPKI